MIQLIYRMSVCHNLKALGCLCARYVYPWYPWVHYVFKLFPSVSISKPSTAKPWRDSIRTSAKKSYWFSRFKGFFNSQRKIYIKRSECLRRSLMLLDCEQNSSQIYFYKGLRKITIWARYFPRLRSNRIEIANLATVSHFFICTFTCTSNDSVNCQMSLPRSKPAEQLSLKVVSELIYTVRVFLENYSSFLL